MNILLTGYTGNLGPAIAASLASHTTWALVRSEATARAIPGVRLVEGSLEELPTALTGEIEMIIHGAASTAFQSSIEDLRRVNVEGTAHLLEFARQCPRLRRFVHLSTTCVCGDRQGFIAEAPLPERAGFVNAYEESKWEAERVVLASGLPAEILRLSIVAGSERIGSVRRLGALHHTLLWLYRGLIPMIPGNSDSRVDLISTEYVTSIVSAVLASKPEPGRIVHGAAGDQAARLGDLLDHLFVRFADSHRGWSAGGIARPDLVNADTFALFENSVRQSGDVLFQRVCSDAQSFLPGLLHNRELETNFARHLPPPNWRNLVDKVFTWLLATDWGRKPERIECHAI